MFIEQPFGTKVCIKCNTRKPLEAFHIARFYGRTNVCKECGNAKKRKRQKARYYDDPNYRLRKASRSKIVKALKNNSNACEKLLGAPIEKVRQHIESKFTQGMTWENHGFGQDKWQIDHIKPCILFDFNNPDDQRKCCHYTNLQPLWSKDNRVKSYQY